jgi:TonB family protein
MKQLFIPLVIAAFFSATTNSHAQKAPKPGFGVHLEQSPAEFPGGQDSLAVFLHRNFKYAKQEQANGKNGQVNVGFTVTKEGKIQDPFVLNGASKEIDDEVIRVVGVMPNWKPSTSGGSPVDVQYILPIDYFIPDKVSQ